MTERQGRIFLALAGRLAPASANLDAEGRKRFLEIIADALATRPRHVQRQVGLFLGVLRWLPALRFGLPLDALAPAKQDAALRWFQDCPIALFRKGFWGMKALAFMGYYGRPELHPDLGYRPSKQGNQLLHA